MSALPSLPAVALAGDLLDYEDAADALAVSVRTVRRLVAQRRLRAVRIGHRTVRFRPADIARCKAAFAGEEVPA